MEGNGWFADLDRAQINRLIQTLRKARDQAFGAPCALPQRRNTAPAQPPG